MAQASIAQNHGIFQKTHFPASFTLYSLINRGVRGGLLTKECGTKCNNLSTRVKNICHCIHSSSLLVRTEAHEQNLFQSSHTCELIKITPVLQPHNFRTLDVKNLRTRTGNPERINTNTMFRVSQKTRCTQKNDHARKPTHLSFI